MAKNEGFFKGEKKKPKKGKDKTISGLTHSSQPTYTMPEVISRKKREN